MYVKGKKKAQIVSNASEESRPHERVRPSRVGFANNTPTLENPSVIPLFVFLFENSFGKYDSRERISEWGGDTARTHANVASALI